MSSFQVYQFVTVDRPLTTEAREALGRLSSRVTLSGPRVVFTYSYGDFRGDPLALVQKYFDVHAYAASYGVRSVALRLPRAAVADAAIAPYVDDDLIRCVRTRDDAVVTFSLQEDWLNDWLEESEVEDCVNALAAMRARVLRGDLGPLYVLWLASLAVEVGEAEDDDLDEEERGEEDRRFEPPVPPGLRRRLAEDSVFLDFFMVDRDLYESAIEVSADIVDPRTRPDDVRAWIAARPTEEKDAWLARVAAGEGAAVEAEIARSFAATFALDGEVSPRRRTVGELVARAAELARERQVAEVAEAQRAAEEARRAAEEARARRLDALAPKVDETWRRLARLVGEAKAKAYDEMVETLLDLRALAERDGELAEFQSRLDAVVSSLSKTSALLRRIKAAKLA
ncbi:MAG: hypothetical protein R3A52_05440 [Polyangiales bacterium]